MKIDVQRGRRRISCLGVAHEPLQSRAGSECGMRGSVRLADLLGALSIVADLGFGLPPETAMRSCLIGAALARKLGVPEEEVAETFYTTLLLHVGCVAFSHETAATMGDELVANSAAAKTNFADPRDVVRTLIPAQTRGLPPLDRARVAAVILVRGKAFGRRFETATCEVARDTARRIGLPQGVQRALYQAHEWWNGAGAPPGLREEEIAVSARIARAASEAALFDDIGGPELAADALRRRAGGILDPAIVDTFVADTTPLLAEARAGDPRERIFEAEPEPVVMADVVDVAVAFADLADLKTPFTHGHSSAVASLATTAAAKARLDGGAVSRLRVAALLHDLGRVGISDAVWEKAGPLTAAEWEQGDTRFDRDQRRQSRVRERSAAHRHGYALT
jgi:HD-GYP domain-containing protein (c-di-GMP phosphodiesterase class II)